MSTAFSFQYKSDPVPIPNSNNEEQAYKDIIRQLAAQAPEPYGAIPPLIKRKNKSKKKKNKRKAPIRRMSHVENWLAVDSKESIPDEEELVQSSPFRNFLSTDFLVLPLHMPPPSLSATTEESPKGQSNDLRPVLYPIKQPPIQVIPISDSRDIEELDDLDEEEEEEEEEDESEEEEEEGEKSLNRKTSIPSFSKSHEPSTSTTKSYAMSASPPSISTPTSIERRWLDTIAQLRSALTLSRTTSDTTKDTKKSADFIPMPPPPKRNVRKKRRSEATTQPRYNPETNTYTRDTRSNPDHLRMISAELNMMRHKKLSSPLKPRGFLPRRQDVFIRGDSRKLSNLKNEL